MSYSDWVLGVPINDNVRNMEQIMQKQKGQTCRLFRLITGIQRKNPEKERAKMLQRLEGLKKENIMLLQVLNKEFFVKKDEIRIDESGNTTIYYEIYNSDSGKQLEMTGISINSDGTGYIREGIEGFPTAKLDFTTSPGKIFSIECGNETKEIGSVRFNPKVLSLLEE